MDETRRIVSLDELDDYKVADEDPDVRGWEVLASDGTKIGEVDDLLIDTTAMKVRYLAIDIDDDLLENEDEDRHILLPIGYARLDEEDDHVLVDNLTTSQIRTLPAFSQDEVTRDYEVSIRRSLDTSFTGTAGTTGTVGTGTTGTVGSTGTGTTRDSDFYDTNLYDENVFYGPRRNT